MSNLARSPLDWIILGLLVSLVATNITFLILQRTGGPLIGLALYLALLVFAWCRRERGRRSVLVGGALGLAVHVVEVATMGWPDYPVLVALNLVLPAALVLSVGAADQKPRQVSSDN